MPAVEPEDPAGDREAPIPGPRRDDRPAEVLDREFEKPEAEPAKADAVPVEKEAGAVRWPEMTTGQLQAALMRSGLSSSTMEAMRAEIAARKAAAEQPVDRHAEMQRASDEDQCDRRREDPHRPWKPQCKATRLGWKRGFRRFSHAASLPAAALATKRMDGEGKGAFHFVRCVQNSESKGFPRFTL